MGNIFSLPLCAIHGHKCTRTVNGQSSLRLKNAEKANKSRFNINPVPPEKLYLNNWVLDTDPRFSSLCDSAEIIMRSIIQLISISRSLVWVMTHPQCSALSFEPRVERRLGGITAPAQTRGILWWGRETSQTCKPGQWDCENMGKICQTRFCFNAFQKKILIGWSEVFFPSRHVCI